RGRQGRRRRAAQDAAGTFHAGWRRPVRRLRQRGQGERRIRGAEYVHRRHHPRRRDRRRRRRVPRSRERSGRRAGARLDDSEERSMATQVKETKPKTSAKAGDHGWFGTETVKTRFGSFEFKNSFPAGPAASQLRNSLVFIRAVEAYMMHMPPV